MCNVTIFHISSKIPTIEPENMAKKIEDTECCEKWKDSLLENINDLVKKMHSEVCSFDGNTGLPSQKSAQLEQICSHLDQAFSYGLRHSLEGYWPFVKEITHKSVIEHILSMPTILCTSEKELMWLLVAINDQTLESYLRSIMFDQRLAGSHYYPFALMKDDQRLQLLIMMMAGLEHVDFDLNLGDAHLTRRIIDAIDHQEMTDGTDSSSINSSDLSLQIGSSPSVDDHTLRLLSWENFPKTEPNSDSDDIIHSSSHRTPRTKPSLKWKTGTLVNMTSQNLAVKLPDIVDINRKEEALMDYIYHSDSNNLDTKSPLNEVPEVPRTEKREAPEGQEDPMVTSSTSVSSKRVSWAPNVQETTSRKRSALGKTVHKLVNLPRPSSVDNAVLKNSREETTAIEEEVIRGRRESMVENTEGQVAVDNNLLLFLMLEVFDGQEETFYKMFRTTMGHTTGKAKVTFVVLTDKNLYLLHEGKRKLRFEIQAKITYDRIDFLQLSINSQILNVVCAGPRRRLWLCTGSESSTCNLVANIEVATRRSGLNPPCVLTDSVSHSIALRKWISEELECQVSEVTILHYALVYWEDTQRSLESDNPTGPRKEGDLMFQYTGPNIENPHWQPGYFILKAGVLYRFSEKCDNKVQAYLQLREGGCGGCRRLSALSTDRPHVIELIMDEDRALRLAASDESSTSDWLCSFLHSASHQEPVNFVPERKDNCKSCSLVLTPKWLFACHEELDTGVTTGVSSIRVPDLVSVSLDSETESVPYCILEIESTEAAESLGEWALYFAASHELQKFCASLGSAWESLFKVPLTLRTVSEPTEVQRYHDTSAQLWKSNS